MGETVGWVTRRAFIFLATLWLSCVLAQVPCVAYGETGELQKGTLKHGGFKRDFIYCIPTSLRADHAPAPLLLVLHGGGGCGLGMVYLTKSRFHALAERDGWLVVYPEALQKQWNDGRRETVQRPGVSREIDDVGFLSKLIDTFVREQGADPRRVYVTGISNGGMMCDRLACELPLKIAATAPVAASLPSRLSKRCVPSHSMPMLRINGDDDPIMPFKGGQIRLLGTRRGEVLPARETAAFWARVNGCDTARPASVDLPDAVPQDKTTVERVTYGKGKVGHEVIQYIVKGGGHTWPQGQPYLRETRVGRVSQEFNACDVIWEFFSKQSR